MASKAEKRRRKRTVIVAKVGRPRQAGLREPNGRLVRSGSSDESSRQARRTAIEARQRHFGVSEGDATAPELGTVLGRLWLYHLRSRDQATGITKDQFDAAMRYQTTRNCYQRSIDAKADYVEPQPEGIRQSHKTYEEWVSDARGAYERMMKVINSICETHRTPAPKEALRLIVLEDRDVYELVGWLRLVLNALAKHFSGEREIMPDVAA